MITKIGETFIEAMDRVCGGAGKFNAMMDDINSGRAATAIRSNGIANMEAIGGGC